MFSVLCTGVLISEDNVRSRRLRRVDVKVRECSVLVVVTISASSSFLRVCGGVG